MTRVRWAAWPTVPALGNDEPSPDVARWSVPDGLKSCTSSVLSRNRRLHRAGLHRLLQELYHGSDPSSRSPEPDAARAHSTHEVIAASRWREASPSGIDKTTLAARRRPCTTHPFPASLDEGRSNLSRGGEMAASKFKSVAPGFRLNVFTNKVLQSILISFLGQY